MIDAFLEYTDGTQSPRLFRTWAAVATIAGALERKVWLRAFKRTLYANVYVLLTGGPGVGKTDALREVTKFWNHLPEIFIAPSSVSRASLTDELAGAARQILRPQDGTFVKFNSLQVCAEEFGTFLTQYETEFMSTLNHLYDCIPYKEKKRSMKEAIILPNPHMNIIAATTPAWLSGTLPDTAWSEGFASRLVLVFSQERIKIDPWGDEVNLEALENSIAYDLQEIHNLWGQFQFEPEAAEVFKTWYMEGCPPVPSHPKLEHYLPRRHIHLMKLWMIMSAARSSDMVLRLIDYQRAMDLLLETEALMPDVFKSMRYNSDTNVTDEVYNWLWQTWAKTKKGVAEHIIVHFISERAPSYAVLKILEVMISSGMLEVSDAGGPKGRPLYKPAPKASH